MTTTVRPEPPSETPNLPGLSEPQEWSAVPGSAEPAEKDPVSGSSELPDNSPAPAPPALTDWTAAAEQPESPARADVGDSYEVPVFLRPGPFIRRVVYLTAADLAIVQDFARSAGLQRGFSLALRFILHDWHGIRLLAAAAGPPNWRRRILPPGDAGEVEDEPFAAGRLTAGDEEDD